MKRLHKHFNSHKMPLLSERAREICPFGFVWEGFPSGQRDQTVNLTRKLRWFESTPLHQQKVAVEVGLTGRRRSGGYSSEVEPQPSKLVARVRFPLPAPCVARIAQVVEHSLGKGEVPSSTLGVSTISMKLVLKLENIFLVEIEF